MKKAPVSEDGWALLQMGKQKCPFCGTVLTVITDDVDCVFLVNDFPVEEDEVFYLPCCEGNEGQVSSEVELCQES